MQQWVFRINIYDLIFAGTIIIGFTFAALLFFSRRIHGNANRLLSLSILTIVLWIVWVVAIDTHLDRYAPLWSWFPLQFSLTLGPLIYFYVKSLLSPELKFKRKAFWHFSPLILEQAGLLKEIIESNYTGKPTYETAAF